MRLSRRKFFTRFFLPLTGLIAGDGFWLERYFIQLKEFPLSESATDDQTLKIVQISDLHLHQVHRGIRQLLEQIRNLKPDLILITGDSVDDKDCLPALVEFLGLLDANTPTFAILGNWEYQGKVDLTKLSAIYKAHGCELLINQSARIRLKNKQLCITGTDDWIGGSADFAKAVVGYQPADFHIVLTHCPGYYDIIRKKYTQAPYPRIDLVLSGHTHGGQITLFGFPVVIPRGSGKYVSGWYREEGPPLFVSRGVGTSVIPFRFFARAEATVFYI